jgi:hypothetical protein
MTIEIKSRDYRDYVFNLSPVFLRGINGERYVGAALGLMSDTFMEAVQQAVLARSFTSPTFPADASAHLGKDRLLPQYPMEDNDVYLAVIKDAWNVWAQAGTDLGLIRQFDRIGVTVEIKGNHEWNWDGSTADWSRFWVIVTNHSWSTDGFWSSPGTWGDGGVWGLSDGPPGAALADSLRGIVAQWKPVHYRCEKIIIVLDPANWTETPDGTWDQWENRDTGAVYMDATGTPTI